MSDKRRTQRFKWQGRVKVVDTLTNKVITTDARVENLSKNGFALVAEAQFERGKNYRFLINAFSMNLNIVARVMHIKTDVVLSTVGVRIEQLAFFERCKINRFIAAQFPKIQATYFLYSMAAGVIGWLIESILIGAGGLIGMLTFTAVSSLFYFLPPY